MRLSEIQSRFKDMILDHPAALENPAVDFAGIFESGDIALSERLKVYRNNVMGSVSSALMSNFPLLEKLVGRDFLAAMTRAYILAHPPLRGHLTFYGDDYDRFIATFAPASHLPYLPDVAKMEILVNRSYHARDDKSLGVDALERIPQDRLASARILLRDGTHLLKSSWPLIKIRAMCMEETDETLDIHSGGVCLLVHRPALNVEITEISESEYIFLEKLKIKTLGEAVTDTIEFHADFNFSASLQRLMALGIFLHPAPHEDAA